MVFKNSLCWIWIFIQFSYYVSGENCTLISKFFMNQNLFVSNGTESIVFLPTEHDYSSHNILFPKYGSNYTLFNEIIYKDLAVRTLLDTHLSISDDELTNAIRQSLINKNVFPNVTSVFFDRYVEITDVRNIRKNSTPFSVFSIIFGDPIRYKLTYETDTLQFIRVNMKGMICKTSFVAGLRYSVLCETIGLRFLPIDESGQIKIVIPL